MPSARFIALVADPVRQLGRSRKYRQCGVPGPFWNASATSPTATAKSLPSTLRSSTDSAAHPQIACFQPVIGLPARSRRFGLHREGSPEIEVRADDGPHLGGGSPAPLMSATRPSSPLPAGHADQRRPRTSGGPRRCSRLNTGKTVEDHPQSDDPAVLDGQVVRGGPAGDQGRLRVVRDQRGLLIAEAGEQ